MEPDFGPWLWLWLLLVPIAYALYDWIATSRALRNHRPVSSRSEDRRFEPGETPSVRR